MPRPALRLLPLCFAISQTVVAQNAVQNWNYCANPDTLPVFNTEVTPTEEREKSDTDIKSDSMNLAKDKVTVFDGDVVLKRSDQYLNTDKITYTHENEQFVTEGPVRYQDKSVRLTADRIDGDQKNDLMHLSGVHYQFSENLGNGTAQLATMQGEIGELDNATYSTCPPGQRQWEFSAGHIKIDQKEARATAKNATLKLGNVPVLWLPYISFPTDDRRRSGLLAPTFGDDQRNGYEVQVPIYWNIAPNYDFLFTPYWMSDRGLMLEGDFRYLGERSAGTVSLNWLPDEDVTHQDRGLVDIKHFTGIDSNWYTSADLNYVSDREYFSDFGQSLNATSMSVLASRAGVYGAGRNWSTSAALEYWQVVNPLLPDDQAPFSRLPRLQATWSSPFENGFEYGIPAELVWFRRDDADSQSDSGTRIDLQPFARMQFSGAAWYVTPELSWRYTKYSNLQDQDLDSGIIGADGNTSPDRSLPIFSLDAGMVFERDVTWSDKHYLQTFEPRLFYLYVPYRNQDNLPVFDSRDLTFAFPALFRTNTFGGADRQSNANQATVAFTTRFYDQDTGTERFNASLGRVSYFEAPLVTLPGSPTPSSNGSAWAGQFDWMISEKWNLGFIEQWDPDASETLLTGVRTQVRWSDIGLLNATYLYRKDSLEQVDLSFHIPIKSDWGIIGRWNYSIQDSRSLESLLGLEWKSCCIALRIVGREFIRSFNGESNFSLYVELELNGLGSVGRSTKALLDNAILGYSQ